MQKLKKILLTYFFPTICAVFLVAVAVSAATTIGANITTGGNIAPSSNNISNLGAYGTAFKDVYASGTVYAYRISTSTLMDIPLSSTMTVPRTIQDKLQETVSVKDFGAKGDGVTDDSAAIQAAIDADTGSYPYEIVFPPGNYRINTGLLIGAHSIRLRANGVVNLDYYGSASAVSSTLVNGTTYPVSIIIDHLDITMWSGTIGFNWAFSYSRCYNCNVTLKTNNQTGIKLPGDNTNGTGPYYNEFYGTVIQADATKTGTIGISMEHVASSSPYRSPNANKFYGGRIGQTVTGIHFEGAGNQAYAMTTEGVISKAYDFSHSDAANGSQQNSVYGGYVEGSATVTVVTFGTNASGNVVEGLYVTSFNTELTDNSTSKDNAYIDYAVKVRVPSKYFTFVQSGPTVRPTIESASYPGINFTDTSQTTLTCDNGSSLSQGSDFFRCYENVSPWKMFLRSGTTNFAFYGTHIIPGNLQGAASSTISSGFGTSPSIAGTDTAGRVTVGTGGDTSGVISFSTAWAQAPVCMAQNETTSQPVRATAVTASLTMTGTFAAADKITYLCIGY